MKAFIWLFCLLSIPSWAQPILHVYSPRDYLPAVLVDRFEQQCRCKVVQDFYGDSVGMWPRLKSRDAPIDVLFSASFFVPELVRRQLIQPLDKSRLPNAANLNPLLVNPIYDPGNRYTLPATLSLAVVGYNIDKLRVLALDPYSWSVLFDPKVLAKLKGHVSVVDNPRMVFAAALMYLGLDPNSNNDDDYQRAREVIARARPFWSVGSRSGNWKNLVSGDDWVQLGYSTAFYQAREAAKREHRPFMIGYVLQHEGNQLVIDDMAIPASAPYPDLALRFINFLLDGKNMAELSNVNGATTVVLNAAPFFRDDIKYHPVINPDPAALRKWPVLGEMPSSRRYQLKLMWREMHTDGAAIEMAPVVPSKKESNVR